jgi:acetylornithine deacetylase
MGRLLARLDALAAELLRRPPHPLTGPPSLHAATLAGGTGWSTYAAECTVRIERRTIPGERAEDAIAEIQAIVDEIAASDPTFRATLTPVLARPPWEAPAASPVAGAVLAAATEVLGAPPRRSGAGYWMDTALIGGAGIDAVVIGADGGGAHTPEEWAELDSVHRLAEVLVRAIEAFCR